MSEPFDLLYMDDDLVVIDKPEGFHVHRPELSGVKVDNSKIILQQLRDQLDRWLYPVHRLDAPTSGCLIMAFNSESASKLSTQFLSKEFRKIYRAVVRGWPQETLQIDIPLESSDKLKLLPSLSRLKRLALAEFDEPVGTRHAKARYSLVELEPVSGRFHQLRRHLNRVAYPVVGDVMHGDRHHNRFFSEKLKIRGLCLMATQLKFIHPKSGNLLEVQAPTNEKWQKIHELF